MALTPEDLVVYLREPAADTALIVQLVALANGLVADLVGGVEPEPARVQAIRLEIAARAYYNPRGLVGETIDDYTWRGQAARAGVYLTDEERAELVSVTVGGLDAPAWSGSLPYRRS